MLWMIRPGVEFVSVQPPFAKVSYFGKTLLIKSDSIDDKFEDFINFLRTPKSIESVHDRFRGIEVNILLAELAKQNICVDGSEFDEGKEGSLQNYFRGFTSDQSVGRYQDILRRAKIKILDRTGLAESIVAKLVPPGIVAATDDAMEARLVVLVGDLYNLNLIRQDSIDLFLKKIPHLIILLEHFGGSVGPVFDDFSGPCFNCYELRRLSNDRFPERTKRFNEKIVEAKAKLVTELNPLVSKIMCSMAFAKIVNYLCGLELQVARFEVREFNLADYSCKVSNLLPVPGCEYCDAQ